MFTLQNISGEIKNGSIGIGIGVDCFIGTDYSPNGVDWGRLTVWNKYLRIFFFVELQRQSIYLMKRQQPS